MFEQDTYPVVSGCPALDRYVARNSAWYRAGDPERAPYKHVGTIRQTFHPDRGWEYHRARHLATASVVRSLKRQGVTAVSVDMGGRRRADFQVGELLPPRRG